MTPSRCFALASVCVAAVSVQSPVASATPAPPQFYVDTTYVQPSGRTIFVPAGGDFQAALNTAQSGDVIALEAGATFAGPFTLPNKPGAGWIIVRTSAPDDRLPPGIRVDPSRAAHMPKLLAAAGPVIRAVLGAHHYRFIGIEIRPREGTFLHNLVLLGLSERSVDQLPHHFVFDRCYLHGDPKRGSRRGILMNSRFTAVVDSYFSDFKEVGADSQAVAGWNGSGPFKIVNNFLEGAGENLMFGGADPSIPDLVPSDIEIRHNDFVKPLAWRQGDSAYAGVPWTVKNLFELKNARRVLVDGNLFERNWVHAQNGFAILFTVRNQDGRAPWSVVEDVTFINNVVRGTASGINILGRDDNYPSQQTKRILIKNNIFLDVGGLKWGGGGRLFQMLNGTAKIVIDHNTAFHTGNIITAEGPPNTDFVFTNNLVAHNEYGILGTGISPGIRTLNTYFPGAVVRKNLIVGGSAVQYPPDNFFTPSFADVDRADVGVDLGALPAAIRPALSSPAASR